MSGRIVGIQLRPASKQPTQPVDSASAIAGRGLDGDHARPGAREITLLSSESWQLACAEAGCEGIEPYRRRANVIVEGVELRAEPGAIMKLGECLVQIEGETAPCSTMDAIHRGLQAALVPDLRGGVHARILEGAEIQVGDPVVWAADS